MFVALAMLGAIVLPGVIAIAVDDTNKLSIAPLPIACFFLCVQGKKCVIVEPANCVGCQQVPQCVQQECDTSCVLPCPVFSKCVLVAGDCCPKPTCRRTQIFTFPPPIPTISFTVGPPKYTPIVNPGGPIRHIP